jgi:hypothetical protein
MSELLDYRLSTVKRYVGCRESEVAALTKRQFTFLLGLVGQTGCVIYDDALRRESSDAGVDAVRDGTIGDAHEDPEWDVAVVDAEASRDAEDDVAHRDAPDAGDPRVADAAADAAADQLGDVVFPPESSTDGKSDVVLGDGAPADVRLDALGDAPSDSPILGCNVDFTVSGVVWDADVSVDAGSGGGRHVRVVGDLGQFGGWEPTLGPALVEKAPGAWSTTLRLASGLTVEFKFVKLGAAGPPEWEQWPPFDSNRSFQVDCASEGGTVWVDASTDAGPAHRAIGRSYGGAFGVKPLDATK